jgi:hypothetical protein
MDKRHIVVTSFLILAATSAPAWAGWGCGYTYTDSIGPGDGRLWGLDTEEEERASALNRCKKVHGSNAKCRIISCKPNIDTAEQAHAIWPPGGPITITCGNPGEKKC